jgi:hypothetical protein
MGERFNGSFLESFVSCCKNVGVLAFLLLLPAVQVWFWLWLFFRSGIIDYVPLFGDWMIYWRESATLHSVLFGGGFYGHEEMISLASKITGKGVTFTHSVTYPLFMGLFGRLLGWELYTPIVWNVAVLTCALAVLHLVVRNFFLSLSVLFFIVTFPVIAFQTAIANQEATNLAIGIIFAVLYLEFYKAKGSAQRGRLRWLVFVFSFVTALIRTDWLFAIFPVVAQRDFWAGSNVKKLCKASLIVLFVGILYFVYGSFVAPYPYDLFPGAPKFGLYPLFELLKGSFLPILHLSAVNIKYLASVDVIINSPVLVSSLIMLLFAVILALSKQSGSPGSVDKGTILAAQVFGTHIIFLFLLFVVYYYMVQADRILMPHYVLCFIVLAYIFRGPFVVAVIAVNIILFPGVVELGRYALSNDYGRSHYARLEMNMYAKDIEANIIYTPEKSPWCNTVAVFDYDFDPILLKIPMPIGMSVMRELPEDFLGSGMPDVNNTLQSKYVYIGSGNKYRGSINANYLRPLVTFPQGTFYLNLLAKQCVE